MPRRPLSLATRLSIWYSLTAFLLVVCAALFQYHSLVVNLAAEDDLDLLERLRTELRAVDDASTHVATDAEARMLVRTLDANCRASRFAGGRYPPASCASRGPTETTMRNWRALDGTRWRIAGTRRPSASDGWIEILFDRSNDERVVRAYRAELSLVIVAALLVAAALGYLIARRGLRPLGGLARRIAAVDVQSLERPLAMSQDHGPQPAEVEALVVSFDTMRRRMDHAFRALTEFSADLAHELRTPLFVLRQQAEVALQRSRSPEEYRELLGSSLDELDRMQRMVDDILFLARAEDPRSVIHPVVLRLDEELPDIAEFLSAEASERDVALSTAVSGNLDLAADRTLVRRALVNVVANALRHTPAGGRVEVRAFASGAGVAIEVADTGEGISAELLPRIFDRHVRGAASQARHPAGAGLGLAMVRGIMTLHGGTAVASSVPGAGTTIRLSFPHSPPSTAARD